MQITELVPVLLASVIVISLNGILTYGLNTNGSVITDCGSTMISREGNITSPSFDVDLQPLFHCDWLVILPEGSSVQLNFLHFDLPEGDNGHCKEGFLLLGTIDTKGNRRSELGPVCGTESPGELTLSRNKFWLSMYGGSTEGGQMSRLYQGFTLSFTQLLPLVHESDGSSQSSGMDQGWYALVVLAGPLLCVIPLYFCLKRRQSIALYCADQDTSEMVVQRFRKKHRPHPDLGGLRDLKIAISNPPVKNGEMSNITAYSYYGGSGDYENVKGYRDDFNLFKNLYVRESSFPSCDGSLESPVFMEESQNLNKTDLPINTSRNFLTVPCRGTRTSRVSYLSILPDFESTLNNSRIQQTPQPPTIASIGKIDGKSVYIVQNQPTDQDKKPIIPTITITSASLRRKQRLSTVKNPEDTNSKVDLIDKSTGRPFRGSIRPNRHAKAWQSVEDIPDESDKCSESVKNPPQATETQNTESSPNTCFEFSTPAILQYRRSIKNEAKKSNEDTPSCLQTENLNENIIKVQDEPELSKTELMSETKYSKENRLNTQNSITSEMEMLQQQLKSPAQMGVDNTAFESSNAGGEFRGSSWNQVIKEGELDNRSKVNDENMTCLNTSNSG
ncbi:uncharacterized protein LOC133194896 [Saccostrea echinata]|uniref:uncharacterized protein LOC133194896 n=1 Tax=Saccostrea echinata TaxID=191078 RepID=UPI002A833151|nr:uncharacterized protein LOC133194896 [Saccostrea echinata]